MRRGTRWALLGGMLAGVAVGAGVIGFALGRHNATAPTAAAVSPSPKSTADLRGCLDLKNTLQTIITSAQQAPARIAAAHTNEDSSDRLHEEAASLVVNRVRVASLNVPDSLRLARDLVLQGLDKESAYMETLATTYTLVLEGESPAINHGGTAELLLEREQADRLLEEARSELSRTPCPSP